MMHIKKRLKNGLVTITGIRVAVIAIVFAAVFLILKMDHDADAERLAPAESESPTERKPKDRRPPWYPFKEKPPDNFRVPQGSVRITDSEAKRFFSDRFESFVGHAMIDPYELAYVKKHLADFIDFSRTHDPVRVAASDQYCPYSMSVPAATGPSQVEPGKALVVFYIPLWIEYDRWFEEAYVRDLFLTAVTHELEHVKTEFWKKPEATNDEASWDEADVWAITCEEAVLPMVRSGREPDVFLRPFCDVYVEAGNNRRAPDFLTFVRSTKSH